VKKMWFVRQWGLSFTLVHVNGSIVRIDADDTRHQLKPKRKGDVEGADDVRVIGVLG